MKDIGIKSRSSMIKITLEIGMVTKSMRKKSLRAHRKAPKIRRRGKKRAF